MSRRNEIKNEKIVNKLKEFNSVLIALSCVNEALAENGVNIKFDYHTSIKFGCAVQSEIEYGNTDPALVISSVTLEALVKGYTSSNY